MNEAPYPPQGISALYTVQGITGTALLERAADAARELGPLPDKVDAAIGTLGLIAVRLMSKPLPDSALDLEMLAKMVRE